jgi:hypothetical protein
MAKITEAIKEHPKIFGTLTGAVSISVLLSLILRIVAIYTAPYNGITPLYVGKLFATTFLENTISIYKLISINLIIGIMLCIVVLYFVKSMSPEAYTVINTISDGSTSLVSTVIGKGEYVVDAVDGITNTVGTVKGAVESLVGTVKDFVSNIPSIPSGGFGGFP